MKLALWVGGGWFLAAGVPWIVGTTLGYNPEFSGLVFLIVFGIAIMIGAYVGQSLM